MKKIVWFLLLIFISNICFADFFIMKDGSTYQGKVVKSTQDTITIQNYMGMSMVLNKSEISKQNLTNDKNEDSVTTTGNNNLTVSDQVLKTEQYNAFVAIQNMQKDTQDMKTIMAWEFGISIGCVVLEIIALIIDKNKSSAITIN
jgi:hypothetical protein